MPSPTPERPKLTRQQFSNRFFEQLVQDRERAREKYGARPIPAGVRPVGSMAEWRRRCGHLIHPPK